MGVRALKGSKLWGGDKIEAALSEEALTAAVMPRYHVYTAIKRTLGVQMEASRTGARSTATPSRSAK
jgi:hypothetical protein